MYLRRADERGSANFGWLNTHHSFSFGQYYDPAHMGFSALRVINDDTVAPKAGFPTHPHRDMEIITYVTQGVIEHMDSMGNKERIPAGDIQVMSAGTGVTHSEYNGSDKEPLRLYQIWIEPNATGVKPRYDQKKVETKGVLTTLVSPDGKDGSLYIHQDASIHLLSLAEGQSHAFAVNNRNLYIHLLEGTALLAGETESNTVSKEAQLEDIKLHKNDAAGFTLTASQSITAESSVKALVFDLPLS